MDLAIQAYRKGDTHEGSEKQQINVYTKINFTYAIPCNDIIACSLSSLNGAILGKTSLSLAFKKHTFTPVLYLPF